MKHLETRGSLELWYEPEPETYTVKIIGTREAGSLEVAREFFTIHETRLNGSQAVTVKGWYEAYL